MNDNNSNNSDKSNPYIMRDKSLEPDFSSLDDEDIADGTISGGSDELATPSHSNEIETSEEMREPKTNSETSGGDKEKSDIGSDIIRGHINTIILRSLYDRDKYGYEIMSDIEQKSHGQYSLKQPTLYSALKRLENQGYIKAYWKTDEVSNGGRRKYFTLTESGKEITEKNLAEWEYSRTIIDSLISDRSFDFSQPAPTPVDFTILRNSVSRVPIVKSDEQGRNESDEGDSSENIDIASAHTSTGTTQQNINQVVDAENAEQIEIQKLPETAKQAESVVNVIERDEVDAQNVETFADKPEKQFTAPPAQPAQSNEEILLAELRRVAHENYLRLISEPVRVQQPENIVPNSQNVSTDSLIYNNRPETERDYKNLVDGIFRKAVANGGVQYVRIEPPKPAPEVQHVRLVDMGRADGVKVATSNNFDSESTYATKTTYNKGKTFLKCSAVVLAITIIECILCSIFLKQLNTVWGYPVVILALGLVQFAVFGILALQGYGRNCVRPTTNSYISSCIILSIIAILIICALSFLLNVNPTSASDVMKMIVIPSITALNLVVFAVCFKAFIR